MGATELFERASEYARLAAKADDPQVRETLLLVSLQLEEEAYGVALPKEGGQPRAHERAD